MRRRVTKKAVDMQVHETRRDFPFRLERYERKGILTMEMLRNRVDYSLIDVMSRLGGWIANNFECDDAKDAVEQFNSVLDEFYGTASKIVHRFQTTRQGKEVDSEELEDSGDGCNGVQYLGVYPIRGGVGAKAPSLPSEEESTRLPVARMVG